MTVPAAKLVRMAEQIAANVVVSDDPDEVGLRLADHMLRFWDPRMRAGFVAHARAGGALSEPLKIAAMRLASGRDSPEV